jgi:hypothetical protein
MFVDGLRREAAAHQVRLIVHSVIPPSTLKRDPVTRAIGQFNAALARDLSAYPSPDQSVVFLDLTLALADADGTLRSDLRLDNIHMNANCVPLLERAMQRNLSA